MALLVSFGLCTWQVVTDGPLRSLDERFGRAVAGSAIPSRAAGFLADLGNMSVALPVLAAALVFAAWCGRRDGTARWWLPPASGALAMAAVPALIVPLKALADRPAPAGPLAGETGFYPSGHAATAAVAYGAAALLLLPWLRHGLRTPLLAGVALLNAAVGAGLVRRGYHWPLDVVASWCLSGCLLCVLAWLIGRERARRRTADPAPPSRRA